MRFAVTLLALGIAMASMTVRADPPIEVSLRTLLGGIERGATDARIRSHGPSAIAPLDRLANDASTPTYVRARAIHAIALFRTPASRRALERACALPDMELAREAVLAIANAFGADAIDAIDAMWSHDAPEVREAVAMALGQIGTEEAKKRLARRLPEERHPYVRAEIHRALGSE
jgi:HEAT repeat protein